MNKINLSKKYIPLIINDTRYFILTGGRGSSKSFTVSTILNALTYEKGHKVLFTRYTLTSAATSIIPEFTEKIDLLHGGGDFGVTKDEVINNTTGSSIIFKGIKTSSGNQTASLKSLQGITTWVLDEAEELVDEATFDKIDLSIRVKGKQNRVILILNPTVRTHWIYKRFFEDMNIPEMFNGQKADVTYIHTTYLDNEKNLSDSFLTKVRSIKETNLKKYNNQVLGAWIEKAEGALWSDDLINATRLKRLDDGALPVTLKRIVVALDPAVTSKDTSDETGIIVAGVGFDDHLYVLDDDSGIYTPTEWATRAIVLYKKYKAERIIGEVNQGGDMIETVLRGIDARVSYKSVHATRDKLTRAEPVASIYEQGKAHHIDQLLELELEMTTWESKKGEKSPNRIDALVWAATELCLNNSIKSAPKYSF